MNAVQEVLDAGGEAVPELMDRVEAGRVEER